MHRNSAASQLVDADDGGGAGGAATAATGVLTGGDGEAGADDAWTTGTGLEGAVLTGPPASGAAIVRGGVDKVSFTGRAVAPKVVTSKIPLGRSLSWPVHQRSNDSDAGVASTCRSEVKNLW